MKQAHDVVEEIYRACPSFLSAAAKLQGHWQDVDGHFALDPFLADFAQHLAEKLECEETDEFPEILETINHLYEEGETQVRRSIVISFVDGLTVKPPGYTTDLEQLIGYLSLDLQCAWVRASSSEEVQEVLNTLFHVCPEFENANEGLGKEYWIYEEEIQLYTILADFARHLVGLLEHGETESFPAIFTEVERLIHEGNHYVSEAMVVGLLEDLQNRNLYTTGNPEQFRQYLKPESEQAWDDLYRFWGEVAAVRQERLLPPSKQIDISQIQDEQLKKIIGATYRPFSPPRMSILTRILQGIRRLFRIQ